MSPQSQTTNRRQSWMRNPPTTPTLTRTTQTTRTRTRGHEVSAQTISKVDSGAPKKVKDDDTAPMRMRRASREGSVVADKPGDSTRSRPLRLRWYRKLAPQPVSEPFSSRASAVPDPVRVAADAKKAQAPLTQRPSAPENLAARRLVDAAVAPTGQRAAAATAGRRSPRFCPCSRTGGDASGSRRDQRPADTAETVSDVVSGVLKAVGVSPLSGNVPGAPVESPASVALFAGWRRLSEQGSTDKTSIVRCNPSSLAKPRTNLGGLCHSAGRVDERAGCPDGGGAQSGYWNGQRVVEWLYRCR